MVIPSLPKLPALSLPAFTTAKPADSSDPSGDCTVLEDGTLYCTSGSSSSGDSGGSGSGSGSGSSGCDPSIDPTCGGLNPISSGWPGIGGGNGGGSGSGPVTTSPVSTNSNSGCSLLSPSSWWTCALRFIMFLLGVIFVIGAIYLFKAEPDISGIVSALKRAPIPVE